MILSTQGPGEHDEEAVRHQPTHQQRDKQRQEKPASRNAGTGGEEVDHILLLSRVEGMSGLKGTLLSARSLASAEAMWRSISDASQIWRKNWLFSSLDRLGLTEGM